MSGKNTNFDHKKIKKVKKAFQIDDVDVNKILVSKKNHALKYFIGYNDNDVIRPLCLRLPQMTGYAKKFNENAAISFKANNKQLLKNYNKIWEKVEKLLKINFESKPVYGDDDKYIKTKIKIYADNVITNFQNKKMPKGKSPCKCLSITMLDSVIKANKKYYPQTLLEECKNIQEKIKIENHIDDDLVNQIVTLLMKQKVILIMINLINNFKEIFSYNKSLMVYVNHVLLGFYLRQSV